MKTIMRNPFRSVIILIIFCIVSLPLLAQQNDLIIMASGEIKQGKVTAMEESAVKFVHAGEDLEYMIKKTEISKIQFASGRVQSFNDEVQAASAPTTPSVTTSTAAERKGKLAVVPVELITNDPSINPETMSIQIQHEAVDSFKKHSRGMTVQDPRTTSSILLKNNIDHSQLNAMAPNEVAAMLGVEYIAYSVVNIENKGTITTGSEVVTYDQKENNTLTSDKKNSRVKGSEVTTVSSNSTIEYNCKVELSVYNDQGSNVYSNSRNTFGINQDSYNAGLNYMIRRTPFGDKRK